ncbi:MAG TPA: YtxH domain-containing protein [Fodinibius sp.]|nr:YtxH domain-containing protein [Fodinibius sp.]
MGTEDKGKVILAAITGVASGLALGLLFAPDKGEETRKMINKKREEYLKELTDEVEELRNNLNQKAADSKEEFSEMGKNVKKKRDDLLKRAKKLTSYDEWTKEELYERAKEAEIEGYSTMNKSELIEALRRR